MAARSHCGEARAELSPAAWRPRAEPESRRYWIEGPNSPCSASVKPNGILLGERLIEAHFVTFGLDFRQRRGRRQRHCRRVDRKHPQHAEQQRGNREQDRHGREQTARDQLSNYSDHAATNSKNRAMSSPDDVLNSPRRQPAIASVRPVGHARQGWHAPSHFVF